MGNRLGQVLVQRGALHRVLVALKPVHVAAQRVDLAVVGDHAERLGQLPTRERVRAVTLVDDRQGGHRAGRTGPG